jgi:hypothetical protein
MTATFALTRSDASPPLVLLPPLHGTTLATVLLAAALPRGLLLLLGGALTDRLSARRVLITTHLVRGTADCSDVPASEDRPAASAASEDTDRSERGEAAP